MPVSLSLHLSLPLSLSSKSKQDLTFLYGFFFSVSQIFTLQHKPLLYQDSNDVFFTLRCTWPLLTFIWPWLHITVTGLPRHGLDWSLWNNTDPGGVQGRFHVTIWLWFWRKQQQTFDLDCPCDPAVYCSPLFVQSLLAGQ